MSKLKEDVKRFGNKRKMFSAKGLNGLTWSVMATRYEETRPWECDTEFTIQVGSEHISFWTLDTKDLPEVVRSLTIIKEQVDEFIEQVNACTEWISAQPAPEKLKTPKK